MIPVWPKKAARKEETPQGDTCMAEKRVARKEENPQGDTCMA